MKRIGILCASDTELAPFLVQIEKPLITERAMLRFYEGTVKSPQRSLALKIRCSGRAGRLRNERQRPALLYCLCKRIKSRIKELLILCEHSMNYKYFT